MRTIYVAQIEYNADMDAKIGSKHGASWHEVEEATLYPGTFIRASWLYPTDDDPRGPRVVIEGSTYAGRVLRVVLYPADGDSGTWRLATAVPLA